MPKIIPLGDFILCKRCKVGEKIGKEGRLYAPDTVKEHSTDLADVVHVPDKTFADTQILKNAESIVAALVQRSISGDSHAFEQVQKLNTFIKVKSLKVGDRVFISKYVGTSFNTSDSTEELTLVRDFDIMGIVQKDEKDKN